MYAVRCSRVGAVVCERCRCCGVGKAGIFSRTLRVAFLTEGIWSLGLGLRIPSRMKKRMENAMEN